MVSINDITWLSKEALEAEVLITDGVFKLLCFSHPCKLQKNDVIKESIRVFEPINVLNIDSKNFKAAKLSTPFGYYIEGRLEDQKLGIVKLGEIQIKLPNYSLPGDIKDNDYISFECERLDV